MGREEKMQALVHYSKKLEPVPDRFRVLDPSQFSVPECQTRVDLYPEFRDGKMHFYSDLNVRQSPTIAAFLVILFSAINDQPPETTSPFRVTLSINSWKGLALPGGVTERHGRPHQALRRARRRRPHRVPMNEAELDDLSTPRDETAAALEICPGDIVIPGAGGKMGPTLARMGLGA